MAELRAPRDENDLTAEWVGAALAEVAGGAVVTGVERRRIGNGMVADSVRLSLTWDRPTAAPASVVAKVPAMEETSRAGAAATRTYLLEAAFYRELAGTLHVHRPHCYLAMHDEQTNDYVVLLEDLAPAVAGDQISGCTVDQAASVIPELAALHGPRWADPALEAIEWLDRPTADSAMMLGPFVETLYPGFVERYAHTVDADVLALAERFIHRIPEYLGRRTRPWTVVHADFRLDNLLFGGPRVAVLDWQTVRLGNAVSDVAYFIGSGLLPDDRRANESALVLDYHSRLLAAGGDLTWDECWHDYRLFGFDGLLMGILASMLVGRTDRGDEMFMAMVNRHGRQLIDLEAERLI